MRAKRILIFTSCIPLLSVFQTPVAKFRQRAGCLKFDRQFMLSRYQLSTAKQFLYSLYRNQKFIITSLSIKRIDFKNIITFAESSAINLCCYVNYLVYNKKYFLFLGNTCMDIFYIITFDYVRILFPGQICHL